MIQLANFLKDICFYPFVFYGVTFRLIYLIYLVFAIFILKLLFGGND